MRLFKTELGQLAFKQRSTLFSGRQRSMFILFNGSKSVQEVLQATAGMGITQTDVEYLLGLGFLSSNASDLSPETGAAPLDTGSAPLEVTSMAAELSAPREPRSEQQRYLEAKPIATQLTASLGLRGFMLNLAVESAAGYADLLKLLPKIQAALGPKACRRLERALLE
jgi:hypothetical protein